MSKENVAVVAEEQPVLSPAEGTYEETLVQKSAEKHTQATSAVTTRVYKEGGIVVREEATEEAITVRVPPHGVPLARVGAEARMTINMGNFESVQLGISIELPCVVEEVTDCYKAARSMVDVRLNKEVSDIRQYRDDKGKPSGDGK